jgi:ribosomal protein S18 acetylase RimI-like enzyme
MSRQHRETPLVRLEPATADEYAAIRLLVLESHAGGLAEARRISLSDAREEAARKIDEVLPRALETPGMLFRTAWVADQPVGHIWSALPAPPDRPEAAWVFFVTVHPECRGNGYGRAILLAAEEELIGLGVPRLELNVFGRNTVAIGLYRSLGYEVTSQQMAKPLQPAPTVT